MKGSDAPPRASFTLRWRREFAFFRLFQIAALLIPRSLHRAIARPVVRGLAIVLARIFGAVRRNLERVLVLPRDAPEARRRREVARRARRAFLNFGTYLYDYAWFAASPHERLRPLVRGAVAGAAALERALERGGGAIVVTGHMGFWDLGAAVLAERGYGVSVVALAGGDPRINRMRDQVRARRSIEILWTGASDSELALIAALRALRENRIVALLVDRPTGGALLDLPFLGRPAPFPVGAAALARAAGVPIFPAFVLLDERTLRYRAVIEPPIEVARTADRSADVRAGTEAVVRVLERYVRAYPEQWYNFYPYWGTEGA